MGAQASHADKAEAPTLARPAGAAERSATGLQLLGATAGNAAVSRMLGGLRPPPVLPSVQRECTTCGDEEERAPRVQRRAGSLRPSLPPSSAGSFGIVPAPVVQRASATAVLDQVESTEGGDQAQESETDESAPAETATAIGDAEHAAGPSVEAVAPAEAGLDHTSAPEAADPAASPALAGAGPVAADASTGTAETSPAPLTIDVDSTSARGPPEADSSPTATDTQSTGLPGAGCGDHGPRSHHRIPF